eukprot:6545143-Alexandrium_andersonii.AAC.1
MPRSSALPSSSATSPSALAPLRAVDWEQVQEREQEQELVQEQEQEEAGAAEEGGEEEGGDGGGRRGQESAAGATVMEDRTVRWLGVFGALEVGRR